MVQNAEDDQRWRCRRLSEKHSNKNRLIRQTFLISFTGRRRRYAVYQNDVVLHQRCSVAVRTGIIIKLISLALYQFDVVAAAVAVVVADDDTVVVIVIIIDHHRNIHLRRVVVVNTKYDL